MADDPSPSTGAHSAGPVAAQPSAGGRRSVSQPPGPDQELYHQFAARSDFLELRRRYRGFAFPATLAFMVWYVTYVVCNNWARGFMDTQVVGHINVAVLFGLLQFVSTFLIAFFYARHANSALDPLASQLLTEFDQATGRGTPTTGSPPPTTPSAGAGDTPETRP